MKRVVIGIAVGALVALAGFVAYGRRFGGGSAEAAWIVASYSSDVLVSIAGRPWREATLKMGLHRGDRLRTLHVAEALLLHDTSHVTVRPRTELSIADLGDATSRFQVAEGVLQVEARGSRIALRTESGATVAARDAGLGLLVRPDGFVHLQVARGEAEFSAMGRTEVVKEGEESTARAGQPPTTPTAIPQAILLNVRFPDADTFNTRLALIEGRTDPGHRVQVAGQWVDVDDEGRWSAEIALEEGMNRIEVEASTPLGRTRRATSDPIRVDTAAPGLSGARMGRRTMEPHGEAAAGTGG